MEVWNQLQTSFSRALARPSALGWKPRKVGAYNPHIRCCGGPCPDYPFCGTPKDPKASCRGIYLELSSGDPDLEAAL